ncbi:MAG: thioesterase domain-containing protein, partial [Clostridia bacterium]|nr:thioesterase domain-containing protein [Clostridia bacterium]
HHTITIGRPIQNAKIYILDKHHNPVPIGCPGEIYIGGETLARGYVNPTGASVHRFMESPFESGQRLYKTGDIGKWLAQGEIAFIGRIDSQVKINGYRIELDEIKTHILQIPGIKDAAVLDQMGANNKALLCAYVISEETGLSEKVRSRLKPILPEYMIPSYVYALKEFPLTTNGKLDRHRLPKPGSESARESIVLPQNETEQRIRDIWQEALKVQPIGIDSSLEDLGGDSLDIITISSGIYRYCQVELPIVDIRKYNTVRKMAQFVQAQKCSDKERDQRVKLLKAGKRNLFFVHSGNGEIENYVSLSGLIEDDFACWAIRREFEDFCPRNLTIPDIAAEYVDVILPVQSKGPYYLAGWSIGGTIAYEMARILESRGERVHFLGLFDSLAPQKWNEHAFTLQSEKLFIKKYFNIKPDSIPGLDTVSALWAYLVDEAGRDEALKALIKAKIPQDISKAIPRYESASIQEIIRYLNGIRSLHLARAEYRPEGKVSCDTYFFNASVDADLKNKSHSYQKWNRLCTKVLTQIDITCDHYSLFQSPFVEELAACLNTILNGEELVKVYA